MSRHKKPRCTELTPDCFNCPFEECIATMQDINRQEAFKAKEERQKMVEKRNFDIIQAFQCGADIKELSQMFNLSCGTVRAIIHPYRISYRSLQRTK